MKTDEKLDPQWIMAKLRALLAEYEQGLEQALINDWHIEMNVTYRPSDGSGGGVTFTVGTRPAEDEE
jgi:hypothetical protein